MIKEFKELFVNDHIYLKGYKIKAFSIAWWTIRVLQCLAGVVGCYILYCLMWLALV